MANIESGKMDLTLVAYYGEKPSAFSELIEVVQQEIIENLPILFMLMNLSRYTPPSSGWRGGASARTSSTLTTLKSGMSCAR
jgi:hypothetical protein